MSGAGNILQRVRELAVQSANASNSASDRQACRPKSASCSVNSTDRPDDRVQRPGCSTAPSVPAVPGRRQRQPDHHHQHRQPAHQHLRQQPAADGRRRRQCWPRSAPTPPPRHAGGQRFAGQRAPSRWPSAAPPRPTPTRSTCVGHHRRRGHRAQRREPGLPPRLPTPTAAVGQQHHPGDLVLGHRHQHADGLSAGGRGDQRPDRQTGVTASLNAAGTAIVLTNATGNDIAVSDTRSSTPATSRCRSSMPPGAASGAAVVLTADANRRHRNTVVATSRWTPEKSFAADVTTSNILAADVGST